MAVNATAVWRTRPSGSNTNGGGYDAGIAGAATDYSTQNAAQATGTNGSATGTTAFTDLTALAFTSAMIGNAVYITGGGLTTGWYFVTGFTSSSVVTLDRTPGTGTLATWNLGGGWADFWTNCNNAGGSPVVAGNTVYVLGSGTPNPASYVYDYLYNDLITLTAGSLSTGLIKYLNDPATPGYKAPPDTTGGMPTVHALGSSRFSVTRGYVAGIWLVGQINWTPNTSTVFGCVVDQFGFDNDAIQSTQSAVIAGCELFDSVGGAAGTNNGVYTVRNTLITGCNIHDRRGVGVVLQGQANIVRNTVIAKCGSDGVQANTVFDSVLNLVENCTIDGNGGHGISVDATATLGITQIFNNIISNQTGGGKAGLNIAAGSAGTNDLVKPFVDYNSYYNNTSNYNAISASPHDTALGSDPYAGQSTENYTLA